MQPTPYTCQFVAYVGARVQRRYMQCNLDFGHSGGHRHGVYVLSAAHELRSADGLTTQPAFHYDTSSIGRGGSEYIS